MKSKESQLPKLNKKPLKGFDLESEFLAGSGGALFYYDGVIEEHIIRKKWR